MQGFEPRTSWSDVKRSVFANFFPVLSGEGFGKTSAGRWTGVEGAGAESAGGISVEALFGTSNLESAVFCRTKESQHSSAGHPRDSYRCRRSPGQGRAIVFANSRGLLFTPTPPLHPG